MVLSGVSQAREQAVLYDAFRADVAGGFVPVGPTAEVGSAVALLTIPAIGVDEVVVEGSASGDLRAGPGHRRDTVLPGQVGVSVVQGRAVTYGGPFARLDELAVGDVVEVVGAQGRQRLAVTGLRRAGDPLPGPLADGEARLTLVTAATDTSLGPFGTGEVLYVDTSTVPVDGEGFPAPGGVPGAVPAGEKPQHVDTAALPLLALQLGGLCVAVVGIALLRRRVTGALVWVVSTPVVLALAWATADSASRLLPNLL
nr:sortase [Nocardioides zeae]